MDTYTCQHIPYLVAVVDYTHVGAATPCLVAIVDYAHVGAATPCLVAIVDYAHVGAATASFEDLVTVPKENSTNQTADILVEDQLQSPWDW